ncbi:hypothetical protein AH68_06900 [Bifidobacterium catenulatum PV20-2]|uniref:Uncharacterized protein n=1 Tax=Bifidobacterium catenulatum PV20-2 TaxID=1447716 RepID=A0A0A7I3B2_9BIFI|nr:hypothetical protein AH68_06900 [Bifidobacterium catenulatum PV20-2]
MNKENNVPEGRVRGFPRLVVGPHVGARRPSQPTNPIRSAPCGGADLRGLPGQGRMPRVRHHGPGPVRHLRRTAPARPTPGAEDRAGGRIPVRPRRPDRRTAARPVHPREPRDRGGGTREGMQTPQDRAAQRTPATMARHHTLDRQGEGPGRRHAHPALAGHPLLKTIRYR